MTLVISHSKKNAKKNLMGYIEKLALDWSEQEIDSKDEVEKYIETMELLQQRYLEVARALGINENKLSFKYKQSIDYGMKSCIMMLALQMKYIYETESTQSRILTGCLILG